jgi:hypothetical protein
VLRCDHRLRGTGGVRASRHQSHEVAVHSAAFAAADRKRTKKWSFVGTRRKRIGESAPVRPMGMGVLSGGAAQPSTNRIVRRIRRSATWPPPDGHLAVTSPPPRCRVDGGSERAGMR